MAEAERVFLNGPSGRIEGVLRRAESPKGAAILAHPHPLYGGTLHHPVIFHSDRSLHGAGWTTLRFNFRGVGQSEGFHDDGRGEAADVGAAVDWLKRQAPDTPLLVVGYSFGARMGLLWALSDPSVFGMIAIGLPVRIWRFDELPSFGRPLAVVQGSRDEFGPLDDVRRVLDAATPQARLFVVEGASHLFPGRAPEAAKRVLQAAETLLDPA
jgi:alpha/beta superfamily hydrolase